MKLRRPIIRRYEFTKAGPGRPTRGTAPKLKTPRGNVSDLREKIAEEVAIIRAAEDEGKPFRKHELVLLLTYIRLTQDFLIPSRTVYL